VLKDLSKTGRLAQYRILYFATHCALTVSGRGLILTPQQEAATDATGKLDRDDGLLTADEIKAFKLDADWLRSRLAARLMAVEKTPTSYRSWQALFSTPGRGLADPLLAGRSGSHRQTHNRSLRRTERKPNDGEARAMRNSMRNLMMHGSLLEAHPSQWAPFVVVGKG